MMHTTPTWTIATVTDETIAERDELPFAAHLDVHEPELSDSFGMPLRKGLDLVHRVATQDPSRANSLGVANKAERVAHFHCETIVHFLELVGAAGCSHPSELSLRHINRRIDQTTDASYEQVFGPTPVPMPSPLDEVGHIPIDNESRLEEATT